MVAPALPEREALGQVVAEFVGAIRESRPALTDGLAGLRVLQILEAASAEPGGRRRLVALELAAMTTSVPIRDSQVLVTGGAGLIGSTIADQLVDAGAGRIVVLDNLTRGRMANLDRAMASGIVEIVDGDIRDRDLLAKLMPGIDIVFHQAAIRITQCAESPRLALEVLVDGTFDVLEAAVDAGVGKVVAASSASVLGLAEEFPTTERTIRTTTARSTARPRRSTRVCCARSTTCTGSTTSPCATSTCTARGWTSTASTPRC